MKKISLSLCALLVLVLVVILFMLPYGLGFVAKNKYSQLLDMFNKSSAIQVTLLDYQRGWFSSEAKVKVVMPSGKQVLLTTGEVPVAKELFIVKQHIAHGPLFSLPSQKGESRLALGQTLISTRINSSLGSIDMVNWVKLNGAIWGTVNAPLLLYTNAPQKQNLQINEFLGTFELSADLKQVVAEVNIPKIAMKMSFLEQQAEQIKLVYHLQKSESGLFLGKHHLTVGLMSWNTPLYPAKWKFVDLKIDGYDEEKKGKINNLIDAELHAIWLNNASFGPQRLILAINQLDVPALLALRKEANNFQGGDVTGSEFSKYHQLFVALLSKGLEIQLKKLEIATPWGTPKMLANLVLPLQPSGGDSVSIGRLIQGRVELNVPATFLVRVLEKINALNQSLDDTPTKNNTMVAGHPTMPSTLNPAQVTQQQVTEWVNQKWLLPKDNGYEMVVVHQNQQTTINGQPLKMESPLNAGANLSHHSIR